MTSPYEVAKAVLTVHADMSSVMNDIEAMKRPISVSMSGLASGMTGAMSSVDVGNFGKAVQDQLASAGAEAKGAKLPGVQVGVGVEDAGKATNEINKAVSSIEVGEFGKALQEQLTVSADTGVQQLAKLGEAVQEVGGESEKAGKKELTAAEARQESLDKQKKAQEDAAKEKAKLDEEERRSESEHIETIEGVKNTLLGLFGVAGAAVGLRELIHVFEECTEAAHQFAESQVRLEALMSIASDTVGFQMDSLRNLTEGISANSTESKVAMSDAASRMLVFNRIQGQVYVRAMHVSNDLAVIFGSVGHASMLLGKALENPAHGLTALQRAGFYFTEQEKRIIKTLAESGRIREAQVFILDKVEARTKGLMGMTMSGEVGRMKLLEKSISDVKREIGEAWMPVHVLGMEMKLSLYEGFKGAVTVIAPFVEVIGMFNKGLGGFPLKLLLVTGAVFGLVKAVSVLKMAIRALSLALLANPWTVGIAAAVALVATLYSVISGGEERAREKAKERHDEAVRMLQEIIALEERRRKKGEPGETPKTKKEKEKLEMEIMVGDTEKETTDVLDRLEKNKKYVEKKAKETREIAERRAGGILVDSPKYTAYSREVARDRRKKHPVEASLVDEAMSREKEAIVQKENLKGELEHYKMWREKGFISEQGYITSVKGALSSFTDKFKEGIGRVFGKHLLGERTSAGYADLGKAVQESVLKIESPMVNLTQQIVDGQKVQTMIMDNGFKGQQGRTIPATLD